MSWILADLQSFFIATPVGSIAFLLFVLFYDQLLLLPRRYLLGALNGPRQPSNEKLPSGVLIIPSLLRAADELDAIKATLGNVVQNGYPGKMLVVASIDGFGDAPALYADLEAWVASQQSTLPAGVWLHLTGTPSRRGKPLAIEQGVRHVEELVARGVHDEFPPIYFSTDADADLGPHALEYLARRLCKRNFFTGNPARAIAGNLHVRNEQYWRGWRHFFSVEGQLTLQVARQYMVSNMIRFNLRPTPICGIPGAFYCTWSDLLVAGPKFMGFMQTINRADWVKWWLGFAPPNFSTSNVAARPELLAGDTDDTVSAFLAIMSRWEDGRLTLDAPRTPVHALYYLLRTFFFDRGLGYEPEAHVYTSSPSTVGSLWRQRMRWNAARIEVAGRFSNSFRYHWDLSVSVMGSVGLMLKSLVFVTFAYIQLPFVAARGGFLLPIALGVGAQLALTTLSTVLALLIDGSFVSKWRLLLAIPMASIYTPVYGFWAGAAGMTKDIVLFGNCTKFAPEATLMKGGSSRLALLARVRRAAILMLRSVIYGDVPLGAFWFGWNETEWAPSGYRGWTTGSRPTFYQRLRYGTALAAVAAEPVVAHAPELELVTATSSMVTALAPALTAAPTLPVGAVIPLRVRRAAARSEPFVDGAPPSQRAA